MSVETIVDLELVGKKGFPRHYAALGLEPPKKQIVVDEEGVVEKIQPSKIDLILAERKARLAAGFTFQFDDERGAHRIGTSEADMAGWREVTDLANALVATGDTTTTITIVTETGPVAVTGPEWQQVLIAAAAFRQPIWAASFALQAMDPMPEDVDNDYWWP